MNLTKLTVLIRTSLGNQGTGTLYISRSSPASVYVITARHCLLEANGDLAFIEGVSIYQQHGEKTYNLTAADRILVHPSVDFALLVLPADPILSIFGELSPLMIAHDNAGETSTFFYGYPKALSLNHPIRVNTTLLPPISGGLINLESNLRSMEAYNKRNLGMAAIHFSTSIKINPNDPNSWYSRAIVKDELHTWKAARRDYDKAIELAPDFIDAIVNLAANKD